MKTLREQYILLRASRNVVLDYCDTINYEDLTKKPQGFNEANMQYLLLHIANTYFFWLKRFMEGTEFDYFSDKNIKNAGDIRKAFDEVNNIAEDFLNKYSDPGLKIEGEIFWLKKNMTFIVLELLKHVMTHEFHHKGQIMSMSRELGYTPPDADIIRFN